MIEVDTTRTARATNGQNRGRPDGQPIALAHAGGTVRLLLTGEQTGGRLAVIERCERRGNEPPLHRHTQEDQFVYVLEGEVTFAAGGEQITRRSGESLLLPRGCEHTFVVGSEQARLLVLLLPAGLEGYYRELSWPAAIGAVDHMASPPDFERLVTIAARYGIEITGPAHQ